MRGPKAATLDLTAAEERGLEMLLRRRSTPQQVALRARIVLAAAAGQSNAEIARRLGVAVETARLWRGRWLGLRAADLAELSVEERLADAPRSGKPVGITAEQTCRIVALACEAPGQSGRRPRAPKPMPFKAVRRHQYWSADIRYIDHTLGDFKVYAVTILDNFSRAVVASGLSRTQDLNAFLLVLSLAIRQHGAPEVLVTDSGSVFRAHQAQRAYAALDIRKHEIARGQPWQNYVEAAFGTQRRMADWGFAHAAIWPELLAVHDQWVADYNYQDHFAHRHRQEDRRSPAAVLHRVCGRLVDPEELHRVFYSTRFGRTLDRAGFARFRRWRIYAERGLAGEPVAVWLYAEHLTLVGKDEPLAQYRVTYQPNKRHLKTVPEAHRYETPHRSPQPSLWAWGDDEWLRVLRLPPYAPREARPGAAKPPPLFDLEGLGCRRPRQAAGARPMEAPMDTMQGWRRERARLDQRVEPLRQQGAHGQATA